MSIRKEIIYYLEDIRGFLKGIAVTKYKWVKIAILIIWLAFIWAVVKVMFDAIF